MATDHLNIFEQNKCTKLFRDCTERFPLLNKTEFYSIFVTLNSVQTHVSINSIENSETTVIAEHNFTDKDFHFPLHFSITM